MIKPDICIIGGGIGGYFLAASAVLAGLEVVLVDNGKGGRDHRQDSDVAVKALFAAGQRVNAMRESSAFGIETGEAVVDFRKVCERVEGIVAAAATNVSNRRLMALGVRVIEAEVAFTDKRTVKAGDHEIRARHFVLASAPLLQIPAIPDIEKVEFLTAGTAWRLKRAPNRLVIVGGGAEGMELAQAFRRLGAKVTLMEGGAVLGQEDPELAGIVKERLRGEGIDLFENCTIRAVRPGARTGIRVNVLHEGDEHLIDGTHLLLASGYRPNFEGLNLEAANISVSDAGLDVDTRLRTSNRRIHAIGGNAAAGWSRQMMEFQAGLVLDSILSRRQSRRQMNLVPRVTFTDPELAHVGLTEAEASAHHKSLSILRWPVFENDRAQIDRQRTGFIKIVADRKGVILGVSIVAANASELINLWSLVLERRLRLRDMKDYIASYPTMGEIGKHAVLSYLSGRKGKPAVRPYNRLLRFFG